MKIENTLFNDYPIEFKEINPEDFKLIFKPNRTRIEREGFEIENKSKKIIITPNEEGYINQALQFQIDLKHKNTVVINAAVGQGKSYAIIQTIKRYYDEMEKGGQKYLIIVASPFVSLVKQYCNDIHKDTKIPENQIYNYDKLGRTPFQPYLNKTVQVVTANTLLGNPGEDGFKNSDIKRKYINDLIKHCKATNKKVVFIYDEIHDSYHNFKEEYIFNLWKWRDVIHKNFILSATYNEASKIVIEYLAELTDRKIKIIESERIRFSEKQSSLHLHYSPAYNFNNETPEITNLLEKLISRGKEIDVLCYSKKLAKSIINPREKLGKLLNDTFGKVKECTSELIAGQRAKNEEPKNQFDNETKCNIGTNFKTGVSIKKENHAFVIIMPPRATKLWFRNKSGIFSGGINSVIQALARQRGKGEIHIILSKPDAFNYQSLNYTEMTQKQKVQFKNLYSQLTYHKTPETLVSYLKMNRQDLLIREFYESKLKGNLEEEIEFIKNTDRDAMPHLKFPTYEQFTLNHGEDFLANNFQFFGEDISSYVTYASITNQFVNCKLKEVFVKPILLFSKGNIQKELGQYYNQYFGEDHFHFFKEWANFPMFYHEIRNTLFKEFELKYKPAVNKKEINITPYNTKTKEFETQLLQFTAKLYYGASYEYFKQRDRNQDSLYLRSDYFLDCIKQVKNSEIDISTATPKELLYLHLSYFRDKLIANVLNYSTNRTSFYYMYNKPPLDFFSLEDIAKFNELEVLTNEDKLLSNSIFEFKRRFENKNIEDKLRSFYNILIEDFLICGKNTKLPSGDIRFPIKKVKAIKSLPYSNNTIDLISLQDYNQEELDKRIEAEIIQVGGKENYTKQQEEINKIFKESLEE